MIHLIYIILIYVALIYRLIPGFRYYYRMYHDLKKGMYAPSTIWELYETTGHMTYYRITAGRSNKVNGFPVITFYTSGKVSLTPSVILGQHWFEYLCPYTLYYRHKFRKFFRDIETFQALQNRQSQEQLNLVEGLTNIYNPDTVIIDHVPLISAQNPMAITDRWERQMREFYIKTKTKDDFKFLK